MRLGPWVQETITLPVSHDHSLGPPLFFKVIEGSHFKVGKFKMLPDPFKQEHPSGGFVTLQDEFLETQLVVLTREGG